ncbi:threonylcarbamoyl-AMP synthase [candidate division WOR-1 bacterium RIFCSPLOWO2_02_FULL_46_20]|uniref:L-threonylcarbamoyladenylate synthase n=2 Tax=Saganbacteria TaxID=1703751 RepID=A0A1F4RF46_UNCSA|nr:MAG: threonylcarbamoyl-AMP synthase [candidate division WOR-1 bacterium RIFCSPLOWO2_02_FULL_46_20]OGC08711.1 MAG: threonylcarbamoyl-AMP synthase [candidate division WOR-1 bacterium RIFCSPLOWO2_12_FULL_45_9]
MYNMIMVKIDQIIAFPTETVFGIGAPLDQPKAIKKIFKIKNRPKNKPLQILIAAIEQAQQLGKFSKKDLAFAKKKWPGPYTLVVYKTRKVPKLVTGGGNKVGLRMPDHEVALELIKKYGPLVATSANRSGEKPALTAEEVKKCLPEIEIIIPGTTKHGKASQVIDLTQGHKVLRY